MRDKQHEIHCWLCDSDSAELIHKQPASKYFPRNIYKCGGCGFAFVYPQPSFELLDKLYGDPEYHRFSTNPENQDHSVNHGLINRSENRIRWISKYIQAGEILDIGCAGGEFIYIASKHGFSARGFDISENAARTAYRLTGKKIYTGDLDLLTSGNIRFDLVTLWEVIEHVRDPVDFLERCKLLLKPGGLIGLSTPNQRNYHGIIHGNNWKGYVDGPEHLHFFNPHTLGNLLEQRGFKILSIRTKRIAPVLFRWAALLGFGNELEVLAQSASGQ